MDTRANNASPSLDVKAFNQKVLQAIEECRQDPKTRRKFSSPHLTRYDDAQLLEILMKIRLGSCDRDMNSYLQSDKADLVTSLNEAYESDSFAGLINHPEMPPEFRDGPPGITPSSSLNSLKGAFDEPFIGNIHKLFIRTLDRERVSYPSNSANRPYSWSISVIQSSGTGKSRMMEEAAKTLFTIPINIRPVLDNASSSHKKTFPPPDVGIRKFFDDRKNESDERQKLAYALLLWSLFDEARKLVERLWPNMTKEDLAQAWAEYLKEGQKEEEAGPNRRGFFADAIREANTREAKSNRRKNAVLVYFDEAHALTSIPDTGSMATRSAYHNLGTVISRLKSCSLFFVFLSTNLHLEGFAPPPSHYPSDRITEGSQLIPPFNELPFDLYRKDALRDIGPLTLENMCKTELIVGFGRPLWYSFYKAYPSGEFFEFAMDKLVASGIRCKEEDARIAAIAVRIMVSFNNAHPTGRAVQLRLTESNMLVVYSIPRNRSRMHTGYPSEPVLAEVAGRYFREPGRLGLPQEGPSILANGCKKGYLARGERGEVTGQFIVTSAYEDALDRYLGPPASYPPELLRHHHPVPLTYLIDALFQEKHHHCIRNATPITAKNGAKTLEQAFTESYVFFSHFAPARDTEMIGPFGLASALTRGMALLDKENQESIDAVIPVHMGPLTTPISPATTSAINLQFKNRKQAAQCSVDRKITVPDTNVPTISIVFEFGVKGDKSGTVAIKQRSPRTVGRNGGSTQLNDHHYHITAYGCNSKVFGTIRPDTEQDYKTILGGASMVEDFPRCNFRDNLDALYDLNPDFSGVLQKKRDPTLFPS
ncbi:G2/mitotic-specific cyclin cdc13 [Ceratobasidium sp. AG-Ba]|nr:G2/mitotic-specific cyclin cdc13 [Ceratobasidium sp. AG-Ba]